MAYARAVLVAWTAAYAAHQVGLAIEAPPIFKAAPFRLQLRPR
jgi:hypothetical protein